jgi:hypothetical protein
MLWIDFGAGPRLGEFFEAWWPRLSGEAGLALVHSTLTNELTRGGWLDGMRAGRPAAPAGHAGRQLDLGLRRLRGAEVDVGDDGADMDTDTDTDATPLPPPPPPSSASSSSAAASSAASAASSSPSSSSSSSLFETLSLLEPHKLFQNSFSIFQKRALGWGEPVYTKFP